MQRRWWSARAALVALVGLLGCGGATLDVHPGDPGGGGSGNPPPSGGGAGGGGGGGSGGQPSGGPDGAPPGPGSDAGLAPDASAGPQRLNLADVPLADRQALYDAIVDWIRTAQVPAHVLGLQVVYWDDPSFNATDMVSVVRGHYGVDHTTVFFFQHHRDYLGELQTHLAGLNLAAAPGGLVPWWDTAMPIPAPFDQVPRPGVDCYTAGRLDNNCDWQFGPLADAAPNLPIKAVWGPGTICTAFADLQTLYVDVHTWHDQIHNTVAGDTFRTFDAPAAPIFWPYHATVDRIFQNWLDCGR